MSGVTKDCAQICSGASLMNEPASPLRTAQCERKLWWWNSTGECGG